MHNIDKIKEFIKLKSRKKALKLELRMIESDISHLEPQIMEQFIEDGVSSIKVDGKPVFLKSQIWAAPRYHEGDNVDDAYQRTCDILKNAGWGYLVAPRFNANSLSSAVREALADGGKLPDEIADALVVTERHSVGVSGA